MIASDTYAILNEGCGSQWLSRPGWVYCNVWYPFMTPSYKAS